MGTWAGSRQARSGWLPSVTVFGIAFTSFSVSGLYHVYSPDGSFVPLQ